MTQALSPPFILGLRPPFRPGAGLPLLRQVFKDRAVAHRFQYMLCVRLPVGCYMQNTAASHFLRQQLNERRLDNTPLMMPFLMPWVRKVYSYSIKSVCRNAFLQQVHGVFTGNTHIIKSVLFNFQQQVPDPGFVYFHPEVILFRMSPGHLPGRVTIAETYFQDDRVAITKKPAEIQFGITAVHPVMWPQFVKRTLLTFGETPATQHETAYRSPHRRGFFAYFLFLGFAGHDLFIVASDT